MSGVDVYGQSKPVSRVLFDKYNTDADTGITKEGFHSLCYSMGHYLDDEAYEAAWTILDADGSSFVSYDESLAWWREDDRWAHLQLNEQQLQNLVQVHEYFRYFDVECSGDLDLAEFEQCYQYMVQSGYALKEFSSSLDEIDKDGNGKVNYNEFIAWCVTLGVLAIEQIQPVQLTT